MAFRSGFFNSVNGDRRYLAFRFAEYFASFIGNGVFPNPSNNLQVIADASNMTVKMKPGKGWINGYIGINDGDYSLQLDTANGALNRIDRIVLRLDFANREILPAIKTGALATSPVAPVLQRDSDMYELGIADVYIAKGTTAIVQANVTDLRLNSLYCGIVAGVVSQIDVSSVFNQYQDWFNSYSVTKAQEFLDWQEQTQMALMNWIDASEADFDSWRQAQKQLFSTWQQGRKEGFDQWFDTVKDILNSTADGTLLNLLEEHKDASMPHVFLDATDNKIYQYGFKTNAAKDGLIFVFEEVL